MHATATRDRRDSTLATVAPSPLFRAVLRLILVLLTLFLALLFVLGITRRADILAPMGDYDDVFVVLGSTFFIPLMTMLYQLMFARLARLTSGREASLWFVGLKILLVVAFLIQQSAIIAFFVYLSSRFYLFLIIPDTVLLVMIVTGKGGEALWGNGYIILLTMKMGLLWPLLSEASVRTDVTPLGANGILAVLMGTIPVIHFPAVISRLKANLSIVEAYGSIMAAVFAHMLHFMDVLELFMQGTNGGIFAPNVQYLIILFALTGNVACNGYFTALFLREDTTDTLLKRFQSTSFEEKVVQSEELLHYFLWCVFFIDLPFASLRIVSFVASHTKISVFLGKNAMMALSVAVLVIHHSRRSTQRRVMV